MFGFRDPFFDFDDSFFGPHSRHAYRSAAASRPSHQQRLTQGSAQSNSNSGSGQLTRSDDNSHNVGLWDFSRYLNEPVTLGLIERDNEYSASITTPQSIQPSQLNIEVRDGVLSISGKNEIKHSSSNSSSHSYSSFSRSMILPENVDESNIQASVDEKANQLMISIPKKTERKTRRIEIGKGSTSSSTNKSPAAQAGGK